MNIFICTSSDTGSGALRSTLEHAGFTVIIRSVAEVAGRQHLPAGTDLAIVDLRGENAAKGPALVRCFLKADVPVIVVSAEDSPPAPLVDEELAGFVAAPYTQPQILKAVQSALARPGGARAVDALASQLRDEV